MAFERKSPRDVARSLGERSRSHKREQNQSGSWRRETFTLSRAEARAKALALLAAKPAPDAALVAERQAARQDQEPRP